jgi:hypothetical protein
MRISKRLILWAYRSRLTLRSSGGFDHEHDPDTFTAWVYFGFFGIALSWSREGWLYPKEATTELAIRMVMRSDPQMQSTAFLDEWDRLDAEENAIDARRFRNP